MRHGRWCVGAQHAEHETVVGGGSDIAAPGDERKGDDDGENGREAGAETCPVQIDERESMVGLIEVNIGRFVADVVGNRQVGLVMEDDWRRCGCSGGSPLPFFQSLFFIVFVDDILGRLGIAHS